MELLGIIKSKIRIEYTRLMLLYRHAFMIRKVIMLYVYILNKLKKKQKMFCNVVMN